MYTKSELTSPPHPTPLALFKIACGYGRNFSISMDEGGGGGGRPTHNHSRMLRSVE